MTSLSTGLRPALSAVRRPSSVHAGLWLDRFLPIQTWHQDREPTEHDKDAARAAKDRLIEDVSGLPLPEGYRAAYEAWAQGLSAGSVMAATGEGRVQGRVVIGLGAKGPAEFGITLHRTWGVPILPGSSLKGIATLGADRYLNSDEWRRRDDHAQSRPGGPNAYDALFGDVEEQGAVIFHDAWLIPPTDQKIPLHRDVMTVHHPGYYQHRQGSPGQPEPSDTDSPIPVPFVTANGSYLIALELHPGLDPVEQAHWLEAAWVALSEGLAHHGVGSKTNAGYGRVTLPTWAETSLGQRTALAAEARRAEQVAARAAAARAALIAAREGMSPEGRAESVTATEGPAVLRAWLKGGPEAQPPLGLTADELQVRAAVKALKQAQGTLTGLKKETAPPWQAWVEAAMGEAAPPPPAPTLRAFEPGELQKVLDACRDRRGAFDGDKAAKLLVQRPLDRPSLEVAIAALTAAGAKPGHIGMLDKALKALLGGAERA